MVDHPGYFAWYELITTDVAAAKVFYADVVGWGTQDASTPDLAYALFTAGATPVGGLMELPEEARQMGATPRWAGYVGVKNIDAAADRIKRLGGAVYVPPTDTNIGRISVVADPQTANVCAGRRAEARPTAAAGPGKPGQVGWHELLASRLGEGACFLSRAFRLAEGGCRNQRWQTPISLFCRRRADDRRHVHQTPNEPVPFWLYYFNVDDIDAAAERVQRAGGRIFAGPLELPAAAGSPDAAIRRAPLCAAGKAGASRAVGWSTEWSGFSSKGQIGDAKPRGSAPTSDPKAIGRSTT